MANKPRKTIEQFVEQAKAKHGERYDYSKAVYSGALVKVEIVCRKHGSFWQRTNEHLSCNGCPECGREDGWLKRRGGVKPPKTFNGNVDGFEYLCREISSKGKILVRCTGCRREFWQGVKSHKAGRGCRNCSLKKAGARKAISKDEMERRLEEATSGRVKLISGYTRPTNFAILQCQDCLYPMLSRPDNRLRNLPCAMCQSLREWKPEFPIRMGKISIGGKQYKTPSKTHEDFVERATKRHGDDFEILSEYTKSCNNIELRCRKCDHKFKRQAGVHLRGGKCPECHRKFLSESRKGNHESFSERASAIHNDRYEYIERYKTATEPIRIYCKKCKREFLQKPHVHLSGHGCQRCKMSRGEVEIEKFLLSNSIEFTHQWRPPSGIYGSKKKSYDFYIPASSSVVEFDGRQHEEVIEYFGGEKELERNKLNDEIKNRWAEENGLKMIRISHRDSRKIPEILAKELLLWQAT